jgi:hypothetical protein
MNTEKKFKKDDILRSALQKAVRRSQLFALMSIMQDLVSNGDEQFLVDRFPIILFEESWHEAANITLSDDLSDTLNNYIHLCLNYKNKDAAGLAYLTNCRNNGDKNVLDDPEYYNAQDFPGAIQDIEAFWREVNNAIDRNIFSDSELNVIDNARVAFNKAYLFHDKIYPLAAVWFIMHHYLPESKPIECEDVKEFPFWMPIDKHTKKGKEVLLDTSRKLGINYEKLKDISFWLEGGICYPEYKSYFYEEALKHKMNSIGCSIEDANKIWANASKLLQISLKKEAKNLEKICMKNVVGYNPSQLLDSKESSLQ